MRNRSGNITLAVLFLLAFVSWAGTRIVANISFDRHITGHLKRAADASTVAMAQKELGVALSSLEADGDTAGFTSLVYNTPDEDVGFWYHNLKAAKAELDSLPQSTTQLERTNVLMKLRETLLDHTDHGESVTTPDGISIYPYNRPFCLWCIASLVGLLIFGGQELLDR